ncbi:MAG: phage terminase small subunit P27 family [Proteobacteria bacterium]|nr:phage terminase small subunit P27 family [Pseudomonadota bacterium]
MKGTKPQLSADRDAIGDVPNAPTWLSKDARAEWRRIMPLLTERRILTTADMGSVENYCIAIGQIRQLDRAIKSEGLVIQTDKGPRANPAVRLQADAMSRSLRLAAELGLTPVSRSRPAIRDLEDDETDSPLDLR